MAHKTLAQQFGEKPGYFNLPINVINYAADTSLAVLPYYQQHPRVKVPTLDQNNPDPHLLNYLRGHPKAAARAPQWLRDALLGANTGIPSVGDPTAPETLAQSGQLGEDIANNLFNQLAPALGQNAANPYQFADSWYSQKFIGPARHPEGWQDIGFSQLRHDLTLPVPIPQVNLGASVNR